MALEPTLDIYSIFINRKTNKDSSSFRDLFINIFNTDNKISNEDLFNKFIQHFTLKLDTTECYVVPGKKKVLTIKPTKSNGDIIAFSPDYHIEEKGYIFSGTLHAGTYGDPNTIIKIEEKK